MAFPGFSPRSQVLGWGEPGASAKPAQLNGSFFSPRRGPEPDREKIQGRFPEQCGTAGPTAQLWSLAPGAFMCQCQEGAGACSVQASPTRSRSLGGSYLGSSLHGLYVCAPSARLILVFLPKSVLPPSELSREAAVAARQPTLRCSSAALPASPST